ncbi:bifunctional riboflavin kinase/FAD synthetase [Litorilinea aerophila]|uniref:bifunctional riboflavin kinase/FAD synthetase n=1 Tax=Litorilinea aerophila TaxID=1204385 RepID=UPI001476E2B3|nr:bifunctional riboflavin kinase/FAD synthetase [Litorilinea aerophila]MCC9078057.1 bifunctional riboflavin kinase/FAD synthetase [Litorilinea aerophila]
MPATARANDERAHMQIFTDVRTVRLNEPLYLTIGNFDGIHRGHQALLRQLQAVAQHAHTGPSARTGLLTFDPHPLRVLRPEVPHKLLTTPQERLLLAGALGIDYGILQPFTLELAGLTPREFMTLLKTHLALAGLVVGPDFALGRGRSGNIQVLQALGQELGYTVTVIEPVDWQGQPVRSSHIRQLLSEGQVAEAAQQLGRWYHVSGTVEEGDRRGRQLGIPTANVRTPPEKLLPADGVYATRTHVHRPGASQAFDSVTNLGLRPTVDGLHRRLETHLLDFPPAGQSDNLYGLTVTVEFIARLRGEQRFASLDALVAQIHADIALARTVLAQEPAGDLPLATALIPAGTGPESSR